MTRWVIAFLLIVLVGLQHRLWVGDGGIRERQVLQRQVEQQRKDNETARERNRTLYAELREIQQSPTAVEERARRELGMVREGEQFIWLIEED